MRDSCLIPRHRTQAGVLLVLLKRNVLQFVHQVSQPCLYLPFKSMFIDTDTCHRALPVIETLWPSDGRPAISASQVNQFSAVHFIRP